MGKGSRAGSGCDISSPSGHSGKDGGDSWARSMDSHLARQIFILVTPFEWKEKDLRIIITIVEQRPAMSQPLVWHHSLKRPSGQLAMNWLYWVPSNLEKPALQEYTHILAIDLPFPSVGLSHDHYLVGLRSVWSTGMKSHTTSHQTVGPRPSRRARVGPGPWAPRLQHIPHLSETAQPRQPWQSAEGAAEVWPLALLWQDGVPISRVQNNHQMKDLFMLFPDILTG